MLDTDQMDTAAPPERLRQASADRTRRNILAAARQEFAEHGLSGARIDAIAARMGTNRRMIYYYFGSKEGLYLATLEQVYGEIRSVEQQLDLDSLTPADAVRRVVEFTFDYQEMHPEFIRLVTIENIHHGRHLARSEQLRNMNMPIIKLLDRVLRRGRQSGEFRAGVGPVDLHMMISAFCFFRVSNRYTFGTLFDCDLSAPPVRHRHKRMIGDAIVAWLQIASDARKAGPRNGRRPSH